MAFVFITCWVDCLYRRHPRMPSHLVATPFPLPNCITPPSSPTLVDSPPANGRPGFPTTFYVDWVRTWQRRRTNVSVREVDMHAIVGDGDTEAHGGSSPSFCPPLAINSTAPAMMSGMELSSFKVYDPRHRCDR